MPWRRIYPTGTDGGIPYHRAANAPGCAGIYLEFHGFSCIGTAEELLQLGTVGNARRSQDLRVHLGIVAERLQSAAVCIFIYTQGSGAGRLAHAGLQVAGRLHQVAASRQVAVGGGTWVDAPVEAATVQKLEDIILTKARDLRRSAIGG